MTIKSLKKVEVTDLARGIRLKTDIETYNNVASIEEDIIGSAKIYRINFNDENITPVQLTQNDYIVNIMP